MEYDIRAVLIVEGVGEKCVEILNAHGIKVTQKLFLTDEELLHDIPDYDALIVQSATRITMKVLLAAKRLQVVACGGAYSKNIDLFAAINRKITVLNAPRSSILSVCEYTCTLIMALARHLMRANCSYRAGIRDTAVWSGSELKGKTLAFVGLGDVAKGVAIRMKSFGMRLIGFDATLTASVYEQIGVIKTCYDEMWPQADYIVLYTSPFDSNISVYITSDVLRACKRGVKIIVVGHVGVFRPRDLYEGLRTGHIGGAGFDLYDEYIDISFLKYPIFQHSSVVCSMHHAMQTRETIERGGQEVAEQIVNLCKPNTYSTPMTSITKLK